ncbi:chorismate-binding protein [Candidatus Micrarchaeota archaeon]|nr:chorismate-binding protein [Candidatus Micrarchaeota archaeon]
MYRKDINRSLIRSYLIAMIIKDLNISLNPYRLYSIIEREYDHSFLLESTQGPEHLARYSFIGFEPETKMVCERGVLRTEDEEYESKDPLETMVEKIPKKNLDYRGFSGGAVGYVSYEYIKRLEQIAGGNEKSSKFPEFEFGIFNDALIYDHLNRKTTYVSHTEDRSAQIIALSKEDTLIGGLECSKAKTNFEKEQFEKAVEIAKQEIVEGEIFQVVLSRKYEFGFDGNLLRFYNQLRQINPSPYMYYLSFGEKRIIGSSPENLVRVEGRKVESYATLAGTIERGKTPEQDKELENRLLNSEKDRAEHLMLVDLTRNDLGKVCRAGSVKVNSLMDVHKYSHVQHLSSAIEGVLEDTKGCADVFNAIFPAGTVSGAPKVRAMEIIDRLEKDARGPYAGAVGYFSFNGNCDFAIGIRTLFSYRSKAYVQAGAGIVYDSIPEKEFIETENKMKALVDTLGVIA